MGGPIFEISLVILTWSSFVTAVLSGVVAIFRAGWSKPADKIRT